MPTSDGERTAGRPTAETTVLPLLKRAVTFRFTFREMILRLRSILFSGGLLLFASAVFGQGEYQQTRNNKTMVWNATPKPGETSSWAGHRDKEKYATGFGDLTWYNAEGKVYTRYYGNTVHGKFEGAVNMHTNGRTAHAYFVDGGRVTAWARGRAPSKMAVPEEAIAEKRKAEAEKAAAAAKSDVPAAPPLEKHLTATAAETEKKPKTQPEKVSPIATKPSTTPTAATRPAVVEKKITRARAKTENAASVFEPTPIPTKSERTSEKAEVRESTKRVAGKKTAKPEEEKVPALGPSEPDRRITESALPTTEPSQPSTQEMPLVAEGPATEQKTEVTGRTPEIDRELSPAPAKKEAPADVSLSTLVGPPSSLRTTAASSPPKTETETSSSRENAPLTEAEAVSLADTEARVQGYQLDDYQRPKVDHSAVKAKWSLFYGLKEGSKAGENGGPFSVTVEDKTRKIELRR